MTESSPSLKLKQAHVALEQSEEVFRLLIESVVDYSIFMLDAEGKVASWNIGAERAKGYKAHEIIGRHFSCFYTEEEAQQQKPQRNLECALREGHCIDEGWRRRKDGSLFWASVTITPVKDREGRLRGFAKVTRDMTEKKRAAEELERRVEERTRDLARSNKELEQFAYVASHDLQEPLRMVALYADLLHARAADKLNQEEREFLQYALDGAERAQRLIRDLLKFSQLGARGEAFKAVDLNLILTDVLRNLKLQLEEAGAEVAAESLPVVRADHSQMFQLFQNLISNAVKYRSQQPLKIAVTAEEEPAVWRIRVQDNGIGIAPAHQKIIFELFQRLHGKGKFSGTGLGLAICKKIVDRHGGDISVESDTGRGAAFLICLPKEPGRQEEKS